MAETTFISVSSSRGPSFYLNMLSLAAATPEERYLLYELFAREMRRLMFLLPGSKFDTHLFSTGWHSMLFFLDSAGVPHYYAGIIYDD